MQDSSAKLAVLIDGDNVSSKYVVGLFAEIAKYGVASVRRVYGDWTQSNHAGWKACLLDHSIQPIQQFAYTIKKNATDGAMIIDAMDLLNTGRFDGFCLVSSDSDFTRLAARIREQGVTVYGFGERKTPRPFVTACNKFIYLEPSQAEDNAISAPIAHTRLKQISPNLDEELVKALRAAIDALSGDDGWAHLGGVGSQINKQIPAFDHRNYGFKKLSALIKELSFVEIEPMRKIVMVRLKT